MSELSEVEAVIERKLHEHEQREIEHVRTLIKALELEAFPDGPSAHRAAHQAMIDAARAQEEFWQGLKVDVAKKSIWGILQILTILVCAGIAAKFGLGTLVAGAVK